MRGLLKRGWVDEETQLINATAFLRDPVKDKDGLSVAIQSRIAVSDWLGNFNKSFGADSLHCGWVRTLGLEVAQTEEDIESFPEHAVILGLPFSDEDPINAERFASKLVKLSRSLDRTIRKKP